MPTRHASARHALCALAGAALLGPLAHHAAARPYDSPVSIYGTVVRQRPWPTTLPWFTAAEYQLMADRFAVVESLDGHGYDWPGAVGGLLSANPAARAVCHWHAMTVQPTGDTFARLNMEEDAFIHSADPASLVAAAHLGATKLWFRRDARAWAIDPEDPEAPTVESYIIERATSPTSAFTQIGTLQEDGSAVKSFANAGINASRLYRVRTKLSDGTVIPYSWNASVDTTVTSAAVATTFSRSTGAVTVTAAGTPPTDPGAVVIEADLNNNHIFEPSERFPCTSTQAETGGTRTYSATVTGEEVNAFYSYRVKINGAVSAPKTGAYQTGGLNNRVQLRGFGALCVWPNNPTWVALTHERMADALALGYAGMRLDFTLDTLDAFWSATGLTPDWQPGDTRIADGVDALLSGLRTAFPQSIITFNGRYTISDPMNYPRYLASADIAEFEYFAVGYEPDHPYMHSSTFGMMENAWLTRHLGKSAAMISGASTTNHQGRLRVIAAYLLICDEQVMLYNHTEDYLEDVVHLPEWELPLGDPLTISRWWYDIDDPRGDLLMSRRFENGEVFYNPHQGSPATIELETPMHGVGITGGLSALVGGDGEITYTPVSGSVTIPPGEPLILVRDTGACPGDANNDNTVDVDDLSIVLGEWGQTVIVHQGGDLSGDGRVDVDDLEAILANWQGGCH